MLHMKDQRSFPTSHSGLYMHCKWKELYESPKKQINQKLLIFILSAGQHFLYTDTAGH